MNIRRLELFREETARLVRETNQIIVDDVVRITQFGAHMWPREVSRPN